MPSPIEQFPALTGIEGLRHGFTLRHPEIPVDVERDTALANLESAHAEAARDLGIGDEITTGEQVHGSHVAVVDSGPAEGFNATDGLVTQIPGRALGVFVADCCAVYLVDPVNRACGIVHSGKKGTELGIAREAVARMQEAFGTEPANLVAQLSPCIRPPHYEIDIAVEIVTQCREAGIPESQVHDCGICTASHPGLYYSYRREKGKTGRMLAMIAWD